MFHVIGFASLGIEMLGSTRESVEYVVDHKFVGAEGVEAEERRELS